MCWRNKHFYSLLPFWATLHVLAWWHIRMFGLLYFLDLFNWSAHMHHSLYSLNYFFLPAKKWILFSWNVSFLDCLSFYFFFSPTHYNNRKCPALGRNSKKILLQFTGKFLGQNKSFLNHWWRQLREPLPWKIRQE